MSDPVPEPQIQSVSPGKIVLLSPAMQMAMLCSIWYAIFWGFVMEIGSEGFGGHLSLRD